MLTRPQGIRFFKKTAFFLIVAVVLGAADLWYVSGVMQGGPVLKYGIFGLKSELSVPASVDMLSRYREYLTHADHGFTIEADGDSFAVSKEGFGRYTIPDLKKLLKAGVGDVHPSKRIYFYGLSYGNALLKEILSSERKEVLLEELNELTVLTLDAVNSFSLEPDILKYNDHVVSDRAEFLLLFSRVLRELSQGKDEMPRIERQLRRDISYLLDDRRFTWQTNHGLMQIRALMTVAFLLPDTPLGVECGNKAEERLNNVLDYFVAPDGAILEAASGYWVYIYGILEQLAGFNDLRPDVRDKLNNVLRKNRDFLSFLVTDEGFLQGMGDSYNLVDLGHFDEYRGKAGERQFSNNLISIRYPASGKTNQVLFVSLDTPPNIHKLPEDLAVYVYSGEPFFINTGTYAYDHSMERLFVLSERSQSTVRFLEEGNPVRSAVRITDDGDGVSGGSIGLVGEKQYPDGSVLTRSVRFTPEKGRLTISDAAASHEVVRAVYNIHPHVKVKHITDSSFVLEGRHHTIHCFYEGKLTIEESWIATEHFNRTPIQRVVLSSVNPVLTMVLPEFAAAFPLQSDESSPDSQRAIRYAELEEIYDLNLNLHTPKRLFTFRLAFLGMMVGGVVLLPLFLRYKLLRGLVWMAGITYIFVLFFDIASDGAVLSLLFI